MPEPSAADLTTSRISRLLRPLRTRCKVLASSVSGSAGKSRHSTSTTYASILNERGLLTDTKAPLAIIPPPQKLRVLSHVDRASRANITLSKMIYDVRDAFRNILQAVGSESSATLHPAGTGKEKSSVPGLAAMCSAFIGAHIEEQIAESREERESVEFADHEDMEVLNEYYDAVPGHYKRYTAVAHALSIVLETCPHEHTLLYILLEVTSSLRLKTESEILLQRLLEVVLYTSTQNPVMPPAARPAISYPAHSNYLTSVRDTLSESTVVNDRGFVRILGEIISQVPWPQKPEVWTSRAIVRLARRFRANDYEAFISLCHWLVLDVAELHTKRRPKDAETFAYQKMCDRLAKWLETLCEHLMHTDRVDGMPLSELRAAAELLATARIAKLCGGHVASSDLKSTADALLCLALLCSSSRHSCFLPPITHTMLTAILQHHRGTDVNTFNTITFIALADVSKDHGDNLALMSGQVNASFASLHGWAAHLRAQELHLLEAWFWSNALAQIEDLCPETGSHYISSLHRRPWADELERLRRETVAKIEEAERLHFARCGTAGELRGAEQTPSKAASADDGATFRWEELVGCWVLSTPSHVNLSARRPLKRSSREGSDDQEDFDSLDQHDAKRVCPPDTPTKRRRRTPSISSAASLSSYASARSSRMSMSMSPRKTKPALQLSTPDDQENVQLEKKLKALEPMKPSRRRSSFASVLADARANRVVLHAASDEETELGGPARKVKKPSARENVAKNEARPKLILAKPNLPPVACVFDMHQASSDDLDLFAHRLSEW